MNSLKLFHKNVWVFLFFLTVCIQVSGQGKVNVYWRSDRTKVLLGQEQNVAQLIGNVVFYHNGSVITCDTAYRYGDNRAEGVGRVIINTDSTFIYGDRFTFDGNTNMAKVYAPLIKTVDKDAVLYTRNMEFNTLTNIGRYYGGGTLTQGDNLMESDRGDYYTATRTIVLAGNVSMENDDYKIKTDSMGVNLNNEFVTFYDQVDIWNHNGEFLKADGGTYDRMLERYNFYRQSYVLTKEQEVWADSMQYGSKTGEALLWRNIQILDTTQMVLSFGDFGRHWGNEKRTVLTDDPSVVTYDSMRPDSSFMRADTLFMVPALDLAKDHNKEQIDSLLHVPLADSLLGDGSLLQIDSTMIPVPVMLDSIVSDTTVIDLVEREKADIKKEKVKITEKKKKTRRKNKPEKPARIRLVDRLRMQMQDTTVTDTLHHDHPADTLSQDSLPRRIVKKVRTEPDSSDYIIRAFNRVRIFKDSVQSVCDSLVIVSMDSTIHMYKSPIVWSDNSQITAEHIIIFSENQQPHRAELYDFPIIGQQLKVDTTRYNQIRGKFMEAFFKNNALDVVYIDGNAETRFYKETDGDIDGLFTATSASMKITFADSQIDQITWYNDITTNLYPLDKIPMTVDLFLTGFRWHESERPQTRNEVFDRTIRPSFRSQALLILPPVFEITTGIDQEKERLLKEGVWTDRNEPLPIDKNELINRIRGEFDSRPGL